MNFNLGDLVVIELLIMQSSKNLEVGSQAGLQIMEILGKCEYQIAALKKAVQTQTPGGLKPPEEPTKKK